MVKHKNQGHTVSITNRNRINDHDATVIRFLVNRDYSEQVDLSAVRSWLTKWRKSEDYTRDLTYIEYAKLADLYRKEHGLERNVSTIELVFSQADTLIHASVAGGLSHVQTMALIAMTDLFAAIAFGVKTDLLIAHTDQLTERMANEPASIRPLILTLLAEFVERANAEEK